MIKVWIPILNLEHNTLAKIKQHSKSVRTLMFSGSILEHLKTKGFNNEPENIRVLTDSECCLIWARVYVLDLR